MYLGSDWVVFLTVQVLADIRPDTNISESFIDRNPVNTTVAVVPDMSEHEVGYVGVYEVVFVSDGGVNVGCSLK